MAEKKLPEGVNMRRALVEPEHPELSIRRQCELLDLNRATYYDVPASVTEPAGEWPPQWFCWASVAV